MTNQILTGHTNQETAYVVADYPYGFRLRTSIRYYIETNKNGQRFVSQTLNPKTGRWNAPKTSTYSAIVVMYIGEDGHVYNAALSWHAWDNHLEGFEAEWGDALTENREREIIRHMHARHRAEKQVTYSVHTCTPETCDRPELHEQTWRERVKEEGRIMNALTRAELWKETDAAVRGEVYP